MTITEMNATHVPQVAELEKICFADPWSEKSVASELDNKWALWFVALEEDKVAGYIGSQTSIDETDVMNVAVHPDFRRRGIAETLINAKKYPEKYNNLAVRVSGFSQKFSLLSPELQDHIIGRTKHTCL